MAVYRFPYYRADENGKPVLQEIVIVADSEEQAQMKVVEELNRRG